MPSGVYKRINPSHRKGKKMSIESKAKMSLYKLGKPRGGNPENWKHTEATKLILKEKLKSFMREKGVSLETRKKLSSSNMGHSVSKETRDKISRFHTGRKASLEDREKMRQANLGRKQSKETILKRVLKNIGQKRSTEVRLRMSELKKGPNSPFWKGGITPIRLAIRSSIRYKLWREAVFKRDNWTCQECGKIGNKLNADHYPISFSTILNKLIVKQGLENLLEKALQYEMFWMMDNGRTLCEGCHRKTPNFAKNYKYH